MNPIQFSKLKDNWLEKENNELKQKRRRRYLHFDDIIESISPFVFNKVTDPAYISRHAFLPLIRRNQEDRLYKKDPETKKKKITKKIRPITYASHFDALVYSWYAFQLEYNYENYLKKTKISDCVIAYRKLSKSNIDFAKEVFDFIKMKKDCVAISFDIHGFYDNLNHTLVKHSWQKILGIEKLPEDHYKVYRSITSFCYADLDEIHNILGIGKHDAQNIKFFLGIDILEKLRVQKKLTKKSIIGIPQGTPISCVLSNMYMLEFDIAVEKKISEVGGLYRRYSDDLIIVCPRDRAQEFHDFLVSEILKIKLIIQSTKTEIRHFTPLKNELICTDENGKKSKLQYLGIDFDGNKILLRHKGYAKYERKMIRAIRAEKHTAEEKKVSIAKRKIYEKYSPLGKNNYVGYAQKASRILKSKPLSDQIGFHRVMKKINNKIKK